MLFFVEGVALIWGQTATVLNININFWFSAVVCGTYLRAVLIWRMCSFGGSTFLSKCVINFCKLLYKKKKKTDCFLLPYMCNFIKAPSLVCIHTVFHSSKLWLKRRFRMLNCENREALGIVPLNLAVTLLSPACFFLVRLKGRLGRKSK